MSEVHKVFIASDGTRIFYDSMTLRAVGEFMTFQHEQYREQLRETPPPGPPDSIEWRESN